MQRSKLRNGLVLIAGALVLTSTIAGAEELRTFRYLSVGGQLLDVTKLNASLNTNGLDDFKTYAVSFGAGGYWSSRRLIVEREIQGLFWHENVSSNTRSSLWAGYGLANTGVNLLPPGGRVNLFPFIGVGAGVFKLDIFDDTRTFSGTVDSPKVASMLLQGTMVLDLGLGVDLTLPFVRKGHAPGIGLRVGYAWDPTEKSEWWSNGTRISSGPSPLLTGPYMKLVVGRTGTVSRSDRTKGCGSSEGCKRAAE